jgi:hypothetical protein
MNRRFQNRTNTQSNISNMLDMTAGGRSSNGGYGGMLDNKSNSLYLSNKSGDRRGFKDNQSPNGSMIHDNSKYQSTHPNNASLMSPSINQTSR